MVSDAVQSLLQPSRTGAESNYGASLRTGETQKCFARIALYFSDVFKPENVSEAWQSAVRQHLCIKGHGTSEDSVMCRLSASNVAAETMETLKIVKQLKETAGNQVQSELGRSRRELLNAKELLTSEKALIK